METIDEQKCEEMSSSPSPENLRICLVGDVSDDPATVEAAKTFGIPIVTSETGDEFASESHWTTHFVMNDFDSPAFHSIHKNKHRIMGPPALQEAVQLKEGLTHSTRPVYNYSMRGVITCFTGIRKKDELTRLVNLIHSMGGSIRKDMNSKVTHLICNTIGGEKYRYAVTFRLAVVRSAWVYEAWEKRNMQDFKATNDDFTKVHKLKVFEGQRICFFGFAPDEHEHMVDVLKSNGGIPTDIEDPECSHLVMANTGDHFPDIISNSRCISPYFNLDDEVDEEAAGVCLETTSQQASEFYIPKRNTNELIVGELINPIREDNIKNLYPSESDAVICTSSVNSTPKISRPVKKYVRDLSDGIVLTTNDEFEFLNPSSLSPVSEVSVHTQPKFFDENLNPAETTINRIEEEDENDFDVSTFNDFKKRKRDSFDDMSIISTDSLTADRYASTVYGSVKKPKLIRTGSITRSIKRSMSFVAIRTPIAGMLRQRRNSVDPNASLNSITSMETTFNESIKNPVKAKLRGIRDRITKSTKREVNITPKTAKLVVSTNMGNLKKMCKIAKPSSSTAATETRFIDLHTPEREQIYKNNDDTVDFKTPQPPLLSSPFHLKSFSSTSLSSNIFHRHSVCGVGSININPRDELCHNSTKRSSSVRKSLAAESLLSSSFTEIVADDLVAKVKEEAINRRSKMTNECDVSLCPNVNDNVVVDEHVVQCKPEPKNKETQLVRSDWFWFTIQNGYADESDYQFSAYLNSVANTPVTDRRDSLPISLNKRKRKRFSQRIQAEGTPLGSGKRRSSVSDAGLLSVSGSFLDCTTSPDKHDAGQVGAGVKLIITDAEQNIDTAPKSKSMRYNHFMDFFNTESNYVGILDTIVNLFKTPLEENAETSDALLNKSEVRAIFNNFLPIHEVHLKMLARLRELQLKWKEDCLIGQIILEQRDDLIKAYPPYVNFFEQMKETLVHCDTQNPRFHAFLKINQAKPECGRQSLQDLMIRPVQRLPSISLLLNDILKHTNKGNPDHKKLDEALKAIKDVMAHINEDKRKTERQLAIFDIFNDIEGCPPDLVSSHRSLISKCEVTELSEGLSGRGDTLMMYLFRDYIEICKRRSRGFNSGKSPSTTKSFKHIMWMPLSAIIFVIDICDTQKAFALNCRHSQDNKDKLYSFIISDEEVDKVIYLRNLCKQMAENACRTDTDKKLVQMTAEELDVDISDVNISTLSKAFKFATRTRLKVGRAFSFNKTPSKLKRAVSTMMTSPFGSTNSLTPASQLAQMKLASCTNINEVGEEDYHLRGSPSTQSEVLVAPMSVQPTRKAKTSTLSMPAIRRL